MHISIWLKFRLITLATCTKFQVIIAVRKILLHNKKCENMANFYTKFKAIKETQKATLSNVNKPARRCSASKSESTV